MRMWYKENCNWKDLRNGKSTNCGCQRIAVNKLELQGKGIWDLVVVEEAGFKIYKTI